MYYD
jgi:hypothetical protein